MQLLRIGSSTWIADPPGAPSATHLAEYIVLLGRGEELKKRLEASPELRCTGNTLRAGPCGGSSFKK